ncbi:MAG: ExeA family protein [Thermodesulfobacteriota bacterium]
MYLLHYGLKTKPFQITTDSKFLWLGENHKEAFATLKYGIWDNKGFLLLTGEVGAGKTTLLNALVNSLDKNVIVARIADPGLSELDFYRLVARSFYFKNIPKNKGDFIYICTSFLNQAYKAGKKVLLIIDEAQRISNELLEDVRLLSNIEKENAKLLNIFFVGQSEFNEILLDPGNRAIRQRITVNYNLEILKEVEVADYIRHRLKVAGATRNIFSRDAIHEIYSFSGGVPRLINIICDRALLTGFVADKSKIGPGIIVECAEDLQIKNPSAAESEEGQLTGPSLPESSNSGKDQPESTEKSKRKEETSTADNRKEAKNAIKLHFFYITLICVLLAVVIIFYLDIGELIRNILLFF